MGLMYYKPLDGSDPVPIAVGATGPEGPQGPQGEPGPPAEPPTPEEIGAVNKAGDTMTGPLTLPGNPSTDLHASTKGYVDGSVAALSWDGTQAEYDALGTYDPNVTYYIVG